MGEGVVVRPDQVSLGLLVKAVPRGGVDDAVAAYGVREKRSDGKLPGQVITYLTLSLFPDDDYEEVATNVPTTMIAGTSGFRVLAHEIRVFRRS